MPNNSGTYSYVQAWLSGSNYYIKYNADGTYSSKTTLTSIGECEDTITNIYATDRAFNFVGGGSGSCTTAAMAPTGFPDSITMDAGANGTKTFLFQYKTSSGRPSYHLIDNDGAQYSITYNTDGTHLSSTNNITGLTTTEWQKSITTREAEGSTHYFGCGTADNLGSHTATENIKLGTKYLSGDGNDEGVYVNGDGEVGIGTNDPQHGLDVNGAINTRIGHMVTTSSNGAMVLNSGPDSDDDAGFWIRANSTLGDILTSTELVRIKADGHVGIGTTDPSVKLDLGQSATNWIRATGMYIEDHDGGFGKIARIYNHNETFGISREADNIGGFEGSLFSVDLNTGNAVFGGNIKTTGVVKIGTQTACASEDEGGIRYVGGAVPYEYCDGGGTWLPFKQPACGDDDTAGCYIDTTRSNSDPELIAANIVSGVNILGVTGTAACGGGGGTVDLIGATHDSNDCVALGGTAFESPEGWICQLSASSCPGGWSQHNSWSATANRTCTGINNDGCWQATSCGTSSHAWSNNGSLETCSYNNSHAVGEAGCNPNGATCNTYRIQIGYI